MNTYYGSYFTVLYILQMISFNPKPYQRSIIISILQIKKLRLQEISKIQWLVRGGGRIQIHAYLITKVIVLGVY